MVGGNRREGVVGRVLYVALIVLGAVPNVSAQTSVAEPGSTDLTTKLKLIFQVQSSDRSPGVAVTVLDNGKMLAKHSAGFASIEHQVPFTHKTVVRLPYSESREYMMTAAVLMEKDGKLRLDDKVRKYFPDLPAWSEPVTVLDLMNHRSGFVDEWATVLLTQNSMANRFDRSQFLTLLYRQPRPEIEPGKGYMYSNSDMGLLKFILEKAAGEPLSAWMKRRMFEPLKMASTRMHDDALAVIPNLAAKYVIGRETRLARPEKISPGGNYFIATSADDIALWSAAHLDASSEIAWAAKQLMQKVRLMPGKKNHYIFGRSVETIGGEEVVFHQGVNGFTYVIEIPKRRVAIVGTTNDGDGITSGLTAVAKHILKTPESEFVKPAFLTNPVAITEAELKKYEGLYIWQDLEAWQSSRPVRRTTVVLVENGALKFRLSGEVTPLTYVGNDKFYFTDGYGVQVEFSKTADGRDQMGLSFDDGFPPIRHIREAATSWSPSPKSLVRFAGRYHSKHLDYYWTIVRGDGDKLILKRPTVADTVLEPDGENTFRFTMEDGHTPGRGFNAWVTFHSDTKGEPTHLTVGYPRLMDHRFDRVRERVCR